MNGNQTGIRTVRERDAVSRKPPALPRVNPTVALPSSLPRRYWVKLIAGLALFAVGYWTLEHVGLVRLARIGWGLLQGSVLLASLGAVLAGTHEVARPLLYAKTGLRTWAQVALAVVLVGVFASVFASAIPRDVLAKQGLGG